MCRVASEKVEGVISGSVNLCRFGSALVVVVRPRMSFSLARFFSPNDDNLGELMSNVCVACVRG